MFSRASKAEPDGSSTSSHRVGRSGADVTDVAHASVAMKVDKVSDT
jgi:hypothetical protein